MNDLKIFNNPEFGAVRTLMIGTEPYFVGKDVAEVLGYSNPRDALAKHVDEEDKGVAKCDTLGGAQELTIINESGLYSLIFSSKLEGARQFKRWVTSEVLPAIRRTGFYGRRRTPRSLTAHKVYYPVLERELEARGILNVEIAETLEITSNALCRKLCGDRRFTLEQAVKLQETWFSDIPVNELFVHK